MNRRELLKMIGLGGSAVAVAAAPKVAEAISGQAGGTGAGNAVSIATRVAAGTPTSIPTYDNSGFGGVPGAIRHLVRERAHGRPMGYMESEDGSLIHWHAVKSNGEIVTGTLDKKNPNFAGKNGLAYYALKNGTNYTGPGRDAYREAASKLKTGGANATLIGEGVNDFTEAPDA